MVGDCVRILQRKKVKGASRVRSFPGISFRIKFISKLLNMIPENLSYHQKKIAITFYKLGRGDHKYTWWNDEILWINHCIHKQIWPVHSEGYMKRTQKCFFSKNKNGYKQAMIKMDMLFQPLTDCNVQWNAQQTVLK